MILVGWPTAPWFGRRVALRSLPYQTSFSNSNPIETILMPNQQLDELSQSQRDRLVFVELRLRFIGEIHRQDLVDRFGIQSASASRDLALYKDIAPHNIEYDAKAKVHVMGAGFKSMFNFSADRVLAWLTRGFGDGEPTPDKALLLSDNPTRLTHPDLDVLSEVTRSIHQKCPLSIRYNSISRGPSERRIVPFALFDNGLRWHVRAFDRDSQEFRDFVITRIEKPMVIAGGMVHHHETSDQDIQWTRIVQLTLVPHPDQPRPEITEMDYGMENGELNIKLRAATAGYTLRKWSVDCSADHHLKGPEYRLWLKDHLALYGAESAVLAPGYGQTDKDGAQP